MEATSDREPVRRFTVDEVLQMVEVGILGEDERLELLGGELVVVTPQGPTHATIVGVVRQVLERAYAGFGHAREEKPLVAGRRDLAEPDLAIVRGSLRDYFRSHPRGADALVVVEIAVTSQRYDQKKVAVYARGGVSTLWLLDVPARLLVVHEAPRADGSYSRVTTLADSDVVALPELAETLAVRELLP